MATSDGITREDWDRVHELAVEIANAEDVQSEVHRSQLLSYLDQLEARYGELPSILATRADYVEDLESKEDLLIRAYKLANAFQDTRNCLHVAHSLAELYIEDLQDLTQGERWVACLGSLLEQMPDSNYAEDFGRLRSTIGRTKGGPTT